MADVDVDEKSLGKGIEIGNGRLINEFAEPVLDDDDEVAGGGAGACNEAAQATTELID